MEDKMGFQSLEKDDYYIKTLMRDMLEHPMGDWVESKVKLPEAH